MGGTMLISPDRSPPPEERLWPNEDSDGWPFQTNEEPPLPPSEFVPISAETDSIQPDQPPAPPDCEEAASYSFQEITETPFANLIVATSLASSEQSPPEKYSKTRRGRRQVSETTGNDELEHKRTHQQTKKKKFQRLQRAESNRTGYQANKPQILERLRIRRQDPDYRAAEAKRNLAWYWTNRPQILERQRIRRQDPDYRAASAAYHHTWNRAHAAEKAAYQRRYRQDTARKKAEAASQHACEEAD